MNILLSGLAGLQNLIRKLGELINSMSLLPEKFKVNLLSNVRSSLTHNSSNDFETE